MKMWVARDRRGLAAFSSKPKKYYANPFDETDYWWISSGYNEVIILDDSQYPEVTIENSPMEVELELIEQHSENTREEG